MKTYSITRIGENKPVNQDSLLCEEKAIGEFSNLFIVADGMGGHNAGEIASETCIQTIREYVEKASGCLSAVSLMKEAIVSANEKIRELAFSDKKFAGCGTTLVFATIKENVLYVANVGDSRLYLVREDEMIQITEDHSVVEELIKEGVVTREKARFHSEKNKITKAVGGENSIEPDFFEVEVKPKDRILLCSDGVSNMMDERELKKFMTADRELSEIGEELVYTAKINGGKDDITAIIVEV